VSRKLGRFCVSDSSIDDEFDTVVAAFSELRIVVVKCEHDFASRTLKYTGICDKFEWVPDTNVIPEYLIMVNTTNNDEPKFSVVAEKDVANDTFLPKVNSLA